MIQSEHPQGSARMCLRATSLCAFMCISFLLLAGGCARFQSRPADHYVYVTAKQTFLRDRVAAVSNRTGMVTNGDKLRVLDRARRFVKVRTDKGEVGWIDEKAVATEAAFDQFAKLGTDHAKDPQVGTATVRDEVYLHIAPGRETDRFYRLAEGDKLSLLSRATLIKAAAPGAAKATAHPPPRPRPQVTGPSTKASGGSLAKDSDEASSTPEPPPPPPMEDWWLVRKSTGETGWIYSHMIDVDAPETLARYAEGQRIVGAYILTHVNDPESGQLRDGQPDPDIPIYVTILCPYKAGLPYDFDQVRVFIWNLKKHRYETAFRQRNIEGYLPVTIKQVTDPYTKQANASTPLPGVTFRVLAADAPPPFPDPVTGVVKPGKLIEKTYRLEGNIMRRIVPPGPVPEDAHPAPEPDRKDAKKKHKH